MPLPDVPVVSGLVQTVFDLGLWDEGGVGTVEGFRGWSGSRQGNTGKGQAPIWVQADTAERGYRPDPVRAGHLERRPGRRRGRPRPAPATR